MKPLFWSVVAFDGLLFLALLVIQLTHRGGVADGGREMGLFFFIFVPVALIGAAVLLYLFTQALVWKILALLIVAGPGLFIAVGQIRGAYIDHVMRQHAAGRGFFASPQLDEMGAAVFAGDLATLQRLGVAADVNAAGERGMTLIGMATTLAAEAPDAAAAGRRRAVVETLLGLGARPGPAMSEALKVKDPGVLAALLRAGGDPNAVTAQGVPIVFEWLAVMPTDNLRLLIDQGLHVDVVHYDTPLAVEVTLQRRFDLLLVLAEAGADLSKPRADGRNVAGELQARAAEARNEGREPSAELQRAMELAGK